MENSHVQIIESTNHHRRPSARDISRHYRNQRKIVALKIAIVVCILGSAFLAFVLGIKIYLLSRENVVLLVESLKKERNLQGLNNELADLRVKLDSLVHHRMPSLRKVQYDTVITIGKKYIKNILFTQIKQGDKIGLEYKVVMQARTLSACPTGARRNISCLQ